MLNNLQSDSLYWSLKSIQFKNNTSKSFCQGKLILYYDQGLIISKNLFLTFIVIVVCRTFTEKQQIYNNKKRYCHPVTSFRFWKTFEKNPREECFLENCSYPLNIIIKVVVFKGSSSLLEYVLASVTSVTILNYKGTTWKLGFSIAGTVQPNDCQRIQSL